MTEEAFRMQLSLKMQAVTEKIIIGCSAFDVEVDEMEFRPKK